MKRWKHSIDIKQHLSSDTFQGNISNEAIVKAAKGIVQELKKIPASFEGLDSVLWPLEDIAESEHDASDNKYLLDDFNYVLSELYDWADDNRIWMGLK